MTKFNLNIFEIIIASLTLLSLAGLCFYFYDILFPDFSQNNPFETFNNDPGIIKISIASFVARIIFILSFISLVFDKFKQNKIILGIYISSALIIAFLQWYELYYGSTFYYGEVRDKQGLMFPVLASLMLTLSIWKINYTKIESQNLKIRLVLTGILNVGLYVLWTQVYEHWNLWQS